jgi:hypothetical protein
MKPVRPVNLLTPLLADAPDLSVLRDESVWSTIQEHAPRYGVAALVAHVARPHVSPQARAWCDRVLVDSWQRHDRMLRHLEYVFELLAAGGVPAIALKGPLLAQRYYSPAFLRKPAMDLDFAVAQRNLSRACGSLERAGYRPVLSVNEAIARSHHLEFTHSSLPKVELHFRLSHMALGIPVDEFFDRTVSLTLPNGCSIPALGPADQLLHLVLHLAHSRFGTLFHRFEMRRAAASESPEVRSEAFRRAVGHHFSGALRMADIASRAEWGRPLISPEFDVPRTWLNWRLDERLYRSFDRWSTPGRRVNPVVRLWGRWLDLQITDTPADALRILKHLTRSARFGNARHFWLQARNLTYVAAAANPTGTNRQHSVRDG